MDSLNETHTHTCWIGIVNLFFIGSNREKNNFLSNNLVTQYWSMSDRLDFLIDYANTILFLLSLSLFSALLTIILTLDIDTYTWWMTVMSVRSKKKKKNSRTSFVPLENFRHSTKEYFRMRDTHTHRQNQRKSTEFLLFIFVFFIYFLTKINFPFHNGSEDKTTNLIQFAFFLVYVDICLLEEISCLHLNHFRLFSLAVF